MLVKFTSETGTVDYRESIAVMLLKAMGCSGKVPGAMQSEHIADALAALQGATSREDSAAVEDDNDHVSLHNRAVPLVGLMQRAVANGEYIMWDYDS